ncbi:MAG: protein kinase [Planctomycetota bacterium]
MADKQPQPAEGFEDQAQEERLGALINEFFDRRESGELLTEDEFLAEHPEDANALKEHLCGLGLLERLSSTDAQRTVSKGGETGSRGGGDGPGSENHARLPEIEGYDVLKQIGRGGMGIVFKALQRSTKRIVALKVLLEGPYASVVARRRFEREIALAAQLRHPNIIPIYDSGASGDRMYFAMEHVFGMPLADYFRAHHVELKGKLKLFIKICNAVRHAHVRGVVHRDLKPSNILVDGEGEPHVLDFGLAKAGALDEMTASITAQIVGTPAYMSPEQASGDPSGIDTRTDVYSMGVMLYETLTGQTPYETTGSMGRILSNIADAEPPPPNKLNAKIDEDLSAIILKALEKRKEDRYQSVDALCSDLKSFLAGEPVSVKAPSGLYLLRKTVWKYRLPVSAAAAIVIVVSAMLMMLQSMRSSQAKTELARKQSRSLERQVSEATEVVKSLEEDAAEQARLRESAETALLQAEAGRKDYARLVKIIAPEVAEVLDPIAQAVSDSAGSGEDPTVVMLSAALALLPEGEPLPKDRPTKNLGFTLPDESVLDTSSGDVGAKPVVSEERRNELRSKLLESLWQQFKTGPALPTTQKSDVTSQPSVTSQPVPASDSLPEPVPKPPASTGSRPSSEAQDAAPTAPAQTHRDPVEHRSENAGPRSRTPLRRTWRF